MDADQDALFQSTLRSQPVAALATLHKGEPATSMVPYALLPRGEGIVIHVSRLATHTADMAAHAGVSLLVIAPADGVTSPLALPRISFQGEARPCLPDEPRYAEARAAYVARFPDSEEIFGFGDFSLMCVAVRSVRFVAGFGRAHALSAEQFALLAP